MIRTPGFGLRDRLRVQDVAGLVRQRHVQADEVCLGEEFVELDLDDAHFLCPLLRTGTDHRR